MSCEYQTRCLSKIHATCQCDRNLWAKKKSEHGSVDTFIIGHVNTRRGLKHISRLRKCMAWIARLVANLYRRPETLSYPFWRWIFIQDGCFMGILTFFGDNNSATSLVNEWRMAIASVFIRRIPISTSGCSKWICVIKGRLWNILRHVFVGSHRSHGIVCNKTKRKKSIFFNLDVYWDDCFFYFHQKLWRFCDQPDLWTIHCAFCTVESNLKDYGGKSRKRGEWTTGTA